MEKDAKDFVRKCNECQRHSPMIYQPEKMLHLVLSPWPFIKWGMDIVNPLPWAHGKAQYILLMTDYFSKWVEAQAFGKVREKEVVGFIWDHIICRFRIPAKIVYNNGKQFVGSKAGSRPSPIGRLEAASREVLQPKSQPSTFQVEDLVLRKVALHTRNPNDGKLDPNWEGPYSVARIIGKGSYKLESGNGVQLPNNWNVTHLKMYYC
nr:uncharacterized protein LOC117273270 [Nicotiana tomentosiformis]